MSDPSKDEPPVTAEVSALRIARVYAESMLNAAGKSGQEVSVLEELDSLVDDVFRAHPQLEVLFSSAAVGRYARQAVLEKGFAGRASELFLNFLLVLSEHERLDLLRPIRLAAHQAHDERNRRLRVLVQSAAPLPDEVRATLEERVRAQYQMEPVLEIRIVPELLGGFKVRVHDHQVDATVSTYLDNLRKYLFARSSHEIQSQRDRFSIAT